MLFTKREARECVQGVLQRYVIPKDYVVGKMFVRWRRTKVTKVYSVTARGGRSRGKSESGENVQPSPSPSFLCCLHHSPCILREPRLPSSSEPLLTSFKSLIESFVLSPTEQLEELILSLLLAHDGKTYLLACNGARTSRKDPSISHTRRSSMPTLDEIERRITDHEQLHRAKVPSLPRLPHKDLSVSVQFRPDPALAIGSPIRPDPTASIVAEHINTVAGSMDRLVEDAKTLKLAFEHLQKIRFCQYPPGFLRSCIHRLYSSISADKQLMKFFVHGGATMLHHIETSVSLVFEVGCSRDKVRNIHRKLNIADSDFQMYLKYFGEALKEEGAGQDDIEKALAFLESFKEMVVTRRRCSIVDMDPLDFQ